MTKEQKNSDAGFDSNRKGAFGGTDMRRSIAVLFCFFLTLVNQNAGATNYVDRAVSRVAQADAAKPNVPQVPATKKNEPAPSSAASAKWQKALVAHLARYKRYPEQGNTPEAVVSVAFTIDRKGNVVSSRIEKSSGSDVLDAEALAMIKRAAPLPAPPAEVAADDLTLVLPIRFAGGEKR
jgi:TonB family protein